MTTLVKQAGNGKSAARKIACLDTETKHSILKAIADEIQEQSSRILEGNALDIERGEKNGLTEALLDRLRLTPERIDEMVNGIKTVISLPDPVGQTIAGWKLENGLSIQKTRVPLGLIGIIYEARPNVTVDAGVLCLKTGNAVLLRGSSSATSSNMALVDTIRRALRRSGAPEDAVQLVDSEDRANVDQLLKMKSQIDVVIPRGSAKLIDYVVQNATVPVLETGAGNCHIYIHHDADPDMAQAIVINAKTQRPSVCNAVETLLVHRIWAKSHLARLVSALQACGVTCHGCPESQEYASGMKPAGEEEWKTEFLDLVIAIKVVETPDEAITHINEYGTKHSEAVITTDERISRKFFQEVDAAAVYWNASTRFTDGFVFGFGAEIGISTQKLHARGPMGLPELTTYKYQLIGNGQVRT